MVEIQCPNCGDPCFDCDLVVHSGDCEICEGELDTTHCGCYYEKKFHIGPQRAGSASVARINAQTKQIKRLLSEVNDA